MRVSFLPFPVSSSRNKPESHPRWPGAASAASVADRETPLGCHRRLACVVRDRGVVSIWLRPLFHHSVARSPHRPSLPSRQARVMKRDRAGERAREGEAESGGLTTTTTTTTREDDERTPASARRVQRRVATLRGGNTHPFRMTCRGNRHARLDATRSPRERVAK